MAQKKIIFTVTNDLTYDQRMQKICRSMVGAGYRVELVGRELSKSKPLTPEPYEQTRLSCFFNKGKLFYIEYNIRLFIYLLFTRFDAACAIDLDTIVPVYYAGKLKGAKLAYDAHEYFTEVPEVIRRPKVQRVWQWVERKYVPKFDLIYTVSPTLANLFAEHYSKEVGVVMNVPPLRDGGPMTEDGSGASLKLIAPKEFSIVKWFLGLSFVLVFVGLLLMLLGNPETNIALHDGYIILAISHAYFAVAFIILSVAAIYNLFTIIARKPLNKRLSKWHFWSIVFAIGYWIALGYVYELLPRPEIYTFETFEDQRKYFLLLFTPEILFLSGAIILLPINLIYSFFTKKSNPSSLPTTQSPVTRHPSPVSYLLYQGALNEGRGLEHLIEAMKDIDSKLLLAGEGDLSNELRALVKQLNLENRVGFLGYVKPADLREITSKAYIGINLLENKGLSYYYSLSNKFFDYIHAGVPQVCISFPEYKVLNEKYNVALLTQDCSKQEIKAAVVRLLTDKELYGTLQKNCEVCSRELNWQAEEKKLAAMYEQLFR